MKASEWRKLNPEKAAAGRRRAHLRRYGISPEAYDQMLADQKFVCAICGEPGKENGRAKRLAVDHDHRSGKVRALLCANCNTAVGLLQDSQVLLAAASLYLTRHEHRGD